VIYCQFKIINTSGLKDSRQDGFSANINAEKIGILDLEKGKSTDILVNIMLLKIVKYLIAYVLIHTVFTMLNIDIFNF